MILDDQLLFARNADCAGAAGTALIGTGKPFHGSEFRMGSAGHATLVVNISEAFAGAGTVEFNFVTDAQDAIATDGSASPLITFGPATVAQLELGARYGVKIPSGTFTNEAFGGLLIVRGGTLTAGSVNCFITYDMQDYVPFPEGNN